MNFFLLNLTKYFVAACCWAPDKPTSMIFLVFSVLVNLLDQKTRVRCDTKPEKVLGTRSVCCWSRAQPRSQGLAEKALGTRLSRAELSDDLKDENFLMLILKGLFGIRKRKISEKRVWCWALGETEVVGKKWGGLRTTSGTRDIQWDLHEVTKKQDVVAFAVTQQICHRMRLLFRLTTTPLPEKGLLKLGALWVVVHCVHLGDELSWCRFAVQQGYWKDDYIQYFAKPSERKAPEISRGKTMALLCAQERCEAASIR